VKIGSYLIWLIVAVGAGVIVLLGYFVDIPLILEARESLMYWAVILAAAAVFMGLINLVVVHWNKISTQSRGWIYSAILVVFLLEMLILGLIFGPDHDLVLLSFTYIQLPVEISLMAILAVVLVVAGFQLIRRRRDLQSMAFMGSALVVLVGTLPWLIGGESGFVRFLGEMRAWLTQVGAVAGARGILLGVALGAAATGLRVIMGADRPYGD
jgi:hypothetical protein